MKRMLLLILAAGMLSAHADLRSFQNTKGEEIMAELTGATESRAELRRADGKTFSVPLASLSEEDRKYVDEWRKTHRHFKVAVAAFIRKNNTEERPGRFEGKKVKGNQCWYVLEFKNKSGDPLTGLTVEYILYAPANVGGEALAGRTAVAAMPAGKSAPGVTAKLFVQQAENVIRSGNFDAVQYAENTLAGIHAEFFVDGQPAGTFVDGKVPENAAEQLAKWRAANAADAPGPAPEKAGGK
jgi:hypothetical protein